MTPPAIGTIAPVIKVAGAELAASTLSALIGMTVSTGLRLPGRARLDFLDDGFSISAGTTFELGAKVVVATGTTTLFTGEITGVELDVERGAPNLRIIADDAAYKMTLGNKTVTYAQMSYSDIVSKIVAAYGLTANISATSDVQEYVLQADSDFGFITEIADRVGYDWWVDGGGTFQFHPMGSQSGTVPEVTWGSAASNLRHFTVRASALHPQQVTVNGWDAGQKQPLTAQSQSVTTKPDAALVTPYLEASSLASSSKVTTAYRMFGAQGDGVKMADSAAIRALAGSVVAEGRCEINAAIVVGHKVKISDVGPASGTYPVTEVEHIYSENGFDTRFVAGDREPTSLADTLAAPVPSSFRQDALVIGVVTNLGDSTSPKGYIKVKYPTLGSQIESAWARVVSMGAGSSRGMTFLPEVNDEVIIGFEGGDVTRPLVLGGLYSGASPALDYGTKDGAIEKRQIVSRLGHVVELGDGQQPADQHIWLTLAGGKHAVKLGKDGLTATVPSGEPISISAGDTKIEFDKQGNITLSGQKVTIKATQDVEISGMNVKLKANVAVEASGTQAKMSGSAQAELSSGGQTAVKGSMVMIN